MEGADVYKFAVLVPRRRAKKRRHTPYTHDETTITAAPSISAHRYSQNPHEATGGEVSDQHDRNGKHLGGQLPILLNEMLEAGKIQKGTKLLFSAFGAGLTSGTCVMIWE
jgi:3-oxoacyl-[acyl-carrier-protein] synthase III